MLLQYSALRNFVLKTFQIKVFMSLRKTFFRSNLLEKVAAFSFNVLSSFLSLSIVSLTSVFSSSYLLFKLLKATSAVFLLDFNTVLRVAICSRLADNRDLRRITCSCNSATSSLFSLTEAAKIFRN